MQATAVLFALVRELEDLFSLWCCQDKSHFSGVVSTLTYWHISGWSESWCVSLGAEVIATTMGVSDNTQKRAACC